MPYKSKWTIPIPSCSLPNFLFTSATHVDPEEKANKPAFISAVDPDNIFLTRASWKLHSQRLALGLNQQRDFEPGDKILVFSTNSLAVVVAFMGIIMAGGVYTAANPAFTARELSFQLSNSEAKYLFVNKATLPIAIEAAKSANLPSSRIRVLDEASLFSESTNNSQNGIESWSNLLAPASSAKSYQWPTLTSPPSASATTVIALNYSSGTTGVPKGVMVTHKNYISNCIQHQHLMTVHPDYAHRNKIARWLCFLPLYHAMGQTIFMAGGPYRGVPVYIMEKFEFESVLRNIERFRITDFQLVPPIAIAVAKSPLAKKYDLSSIHAIGCGAAPLGAEASRELEKVWSGKLNLKQGWGMTEVTCSLLGWGSNEYSGSYSVGHPNANCEAKIMRAEIDAQGKETEEFKEMTSHDPQEGRGELWVRGPNVMFGYWKNEAATRATFDPVSQGRGAGESDADGNSRWLRTGDIAYVDEEGHFFIVDRMKELIKVKGNQVAPAELEALLIEHSAIMDVAVIGVPGKDGTDEVPRAYVVKTPSKKGQELTEQEVKKYVEERCIRYKWLAGGVEFVDAIVKNPSGKILRREIREAYKKKMEREKGGKHGEARL